MAVNPLDMLDPQVLTNQLNHVQDMSNVINSHSATGYNPASDFNSPIDMLIASLEGVQSSYGYDLSSIIKSIKEAAARGDYRAIQGYLAGLPSSVQVNPELIKFIDNMIAQQSTGEARTWEEEQASTNLLKAGSQLEQLGLSPSGVLQTGGSNVNGVAAADNSMQNMAFQSKMAKYQQRMAIAKQLLSMTSSMASAGIYGHAIGAARKASSVLTSSASHSALGVLSGNSGYKGPSWDQLMKDLDNGPEDNDMSFI